MADSGSSAAAMLLGGLAAPAFAADTGSTWPPPPVITAGDRTATLAGDIAFPALSADHNIQCNVDQATSIEVNDLSASNAGWSVTVVSSALVGTSGPALFVDGTIAGNDLERRQLRCARRRQRGHGRRHYQHRARHPRHDRHAHQLVDGARRVRSGRLHPGVQRGPVHARRQPGRRLCRHPDRHHRPDVLGHTNHTRSADHAQPVWARSP